MPTSRREYTSPRPQRRRSSRRSRNDNDIRGRYDYDSEYVSSGLSEILNHRVVNHRSLTPITLDCDRKTSDGYLTNKQLAEYHPREHPDVARERPVCRPNAEYIVRGEGRFKCSSPCFLVDASGVTNKAANSPIYGNYPSHTRGW
eukprot:TRINITY_DN3742_c0_g2_i1.p1 TRINITY_DN3742_c0_g2~~TRINITY_DN3742_c0_g2_i1.p1  ORF type:complete len:145 (+),score=7.50 TRINITY_DN3742_c0_g2_i1:47-481(+)